MVGACSLYIKAHSYGEYVFDHAWANAYAQHGDQGFGIVIEAMLRIGVGPGVVKHILAIGMRFDVQRAGADHLITEPQRDGARCPAGARAGGS